MGYSSETTLWLDQARKYIAQKARETGDMEVSVNDLYKAIVNAELVAPPLQKSVPSGQSLSAVFSGCDQFIKTGRLIAGINPHSRQRKVNLWLYMPEAEKPVTRSFSRMCESATDW